MVIRKLKSSRNKGVHSHSCPKEQERVPLTACDGCPSFVSVKHNTSSHEVTCKFETENALPQLKPSKAYAESTMAAYMGTDPLQVMSNTWLQPKYDGARVLLHITLDGVRVTTRNVDRYGLYSEITGNFTGMFDAMAPKYLELMNGTILDGEVIYTQQLGDATGTLGSTMKFVGSSPEKAKKITDEIGFPNIFVFDLLFFLGADYRDRPYSDRWQLAKAQAGRMAEKVPNVAPILNYDASTWSIEQKQDLHQAHLDNDWEGLVCKDPSKKYNERYFMLKAKEQVTVDVLVTGFEYGEEGSKYEKVIGAFAVSVIDQATGELREIGKVPPGDDATRQQFTTILESSSWEEERIVIELKAQNFTKEYKLRHAAIVRYRPDRSEPNTLDFTKVRRK